MKKKILWSGVVILALALIGGAVWWYLRPQVITFDDGAQLTLMGVDYGQRHKLSTVKHSFRTTEDTLVVWVRQKYDAQNWANFEYYLYDPANTACVPESDTHYGGGGNRGNEIVGVQFSAFPRRGGKFYVLAMENGPGGQELSDTRFTISSPVHRAHAQWAATSLPDTEEDGNFSATLKKFVTGAKANNNRAGADDDDPINQGIQAVFNVQIDGTNANNWQPVAVVTSDATSNHVEADSVNTAPQGGDLMTTYQYGLWPNESAWKVRVEFSKQSGFTESELWKVFSIPVVDDRMRNFWNYGRRADPASVFAENDLQGLHLKIFKVKHFTDMPPNSQPQGGLIIETDPALPDGTRLNLVKLTDDHDNDVRYWDNGSGPSRNGIAYRYGLPNMDGVTNLNLTLAVHQSHFLEFNVKPEVQTPPADANDSPDQ